MRKKFLMAFVLTLGLGAGCARPVPAPVSVPIKTPEALHAEWKTRTGEILQTFDRDGNAQVARDALLSLRVSSADKNLHQELVFAFAAIADGDKKGTERLSKARAAFQVQM